MIIIIVIPSKLTEAVNLFIYILKIIVSNFGHDNDYAAQGVSSLKR
jgi:hypothetical protein